MACCPDGSIGAPPIEGYAWMDKGVVEQVGDLKVYRVGESNRCIIWCYDIYGFKSGRTREMCDKLASFGYMVLLPDFFRGEWRDVNSPDLKNWIIKQTDWFGKLQIDVVETLIPYARSQGATCLGAAGTCWGAYMVARLCQYTDFQAGASLHPAITFVTEVLGEDVYELLEEVTCPQLLLTAGNDHDNEKKAGLADKIWGCMPFGDKCQYREYPDMVHGWVTRGDTRNIEVANAAKAALNSLLAFFDTYVK